MPSSSSDEEPHDAHTLERFSSALGSDLRLSDMAREVAVVTGAAQGIGRGIAEVLAQRPGCVVCILDFNAAALAAASDAIPGKVDAFRVDITVPQQVEETMATIVQRYGRIDLLVNNAGRQECIGASWESDPAAWWGDVTVNLYGSYLCTRYALPHMIRAGAAGTVICMAGGGYDGPNPGLGGYGASKAGLMRFVDNLAVELRTAGHGELSVLGMWPGFVNTHMIDLLTSRAEGKKWLPHVTTGLAKGEDHPAEVSSPATREAEQSRES